MLFSRDWLADYVDLPADPAELARLLTAGGFAVEQVTESGDDVLLDVDVTTNRPDAMCHAGLAREAAVLGGTALRLPEPELAEGEEPAAAAIRVAIDAPELCSRYAARVVRGVTVGPSPEWLARRLEAIGVRPINNVVDVTNYVLWELGQPLHAFDLATIEGGEIRVRHAADGETLTTLDGEERKLDPETLVIADARRPVALAGVMGGLDTEVTEETTDVLLESAWFEPAAVRRTAKAHGLHTDASHRFERGADPSAQARAAARAAALVAELAGGTVLAGAVDAVAREHPERTLELDLDRLDAFAGARLPRERIAGWFEGLGFRVAEAGNGSGDDGARRLAVTVPPWRLFDVEEEADLFEEPIRIHGFDALPATLPAISGADGPPTPRQRLRRALRRRLAAAGYAEAIDFAFHSRDAAAEAPGLAGPPGTDVELVPLANPLSELYSVLRASLLPGLLASARFNLRRNADAVRLYELGVVFAAGPDGTVVEREHLALVAGGTVGSPWQGRREIDFFDLKGVVEEAAAAAGRALEARPATVAGLVKGAAAELVVLENGEAAGADGERVGILGQLDVEDEGAPLFAAEIALDALEADGGPAGKPVSVPPRLPGIEVDLTFTHALDVAWADIAAALEAVRPPELARFELKDRYRGEGVPEGAVNTTIGFHYHGGDRQLTQDEVNRHHQELARHLGERFGWRREEDAE